MTLRIIITLGGLLISVLLMSIGYMIAKREQMSVQDATAAYYETFRVLKRHCEVNERGEFKIDMRDGRPQCLVTSTSL